MAENNASKINSREAEVETYAISLTPNVLDKKWGS